MPLLLLVFGGDKMALMASCPFAETLTFFPAKLVPPGIFFLFDLSYVIISWNEKCIFVSS